MAERFAAGGRLIAAGSSPAGRSDARHVAVEFVHPVIVGKRALPAIGLAGEGGPLAAQIALTVEPGDIFMPFDAEALEAPGDVLTIVASIPRPDDPFVRQEIVETRYHLLWELVHVFFEHRGAAPGATRARRRSCTPSSTRARPDVDAVLADVAASVRMKSAEVAELREQTLREGADALMVGRRGAARALRGRRAAARARQRRLGDRRDGRGGRLPPPAAGGWLPRPVLDLTEDAAILTALANDIGVEAVFARQVIAHGRPGDALLAISTSGGSGNVLAALAEARRRGMATIALVGYDGGEIAAGGLADHVVVTRSQHIPRIQEAQASAYHVLRELVG